MKTCRTCLCVALLAFCAEARATDLYDLDFTPPEVGQYQVVFGTPTVQSAVGPFTDALVFDAVTSYEQIRLPIFASGPRYEIDCDVLVHNLRDSQYAFGVVADVPDVRVVDFHGGLNSISIFQPGGGGAFAGGSFFNDQVYHLTITLDLTANLWSVAVNGVERYLGALNATSVQSIRFTMSPIIGGAQNAPGTYGALDSVRVRVVPEPQPVWLILLPLPALLAWRWSRRLPRAG